MKKRQFIRILWMAYALATFWTVVRAFTFQGFSFWLSALMPLLGFSFSVLHSWEALGSKAAGILLGLSLLISGGFELLSLNTGWIFGEYAYTYRLGARLFGQLPVVIPLSWFLILYPAYQVVSAFYPWNKASLGVDLIYAALVGLAVMSWDVILDPLMTLREHWVWKQAGEFFGVPYQNFFGWWLTAFAIVFLTHRIWRFTSLQPQRLPMDEYLLPIGAYFFAGLGTFSEAFTAGLHLPAGLGGFAMAFWCGFALMKLWNERRVSRVNS